MLRIPPPWGAGYYGGLAAGDRPGSVEARKQIGVPADGAGQAQADTNDVSQIEAQTCSLRLAAQGVNESCSRQRCSFWEPGGAVAEGGCVIDRLGVDVGRTDLAEYLLDVRDRLEQAKNLAEAEAAHREFSRRVGLEL